MAFRDPFGTYKRAAYQKKIIINLPGRWSAVSGPNWGSPGRGWGRGSGGVSGDAVGIRMAYLGYDKVVCSISSPSVGAGESRCCTSCARSLRPGRSKSSPRAANRLYICHICFLSVCDVVLVPSVGRRRFEITTSVGSEAWGTVSRWVPGVTATSRQCKEACLRLTAVWVAPCSPCNLPVGL